MKNKIIQIAVEPGTENSSSMLYFLYSDGTVKSRYYDYDRNKQVFETIVKGEGDARE